MAEIRSGKCPNCGTPVRYEVGDASVACPNCGVESGVSAIETGERSSVQRARGASFGGAMGGFGAPVMGFDNPESAVVFIQNFFETFDWESYKETSEIEICEIAEAVYNNKLKNGANGLSWYVDFKALSVPLGQKIAGLKELAEKIGKAYNAEDASESLALFDVYKNIILAIIDNKDEYLKRLNAGVRYAQAFNVDKAKLDEITNELNAITTTINSLKEVKEIEEVSEYVIARDNASKEVAKVLQEKGIEAENVYVEAIAKYNTGGVSRNLALAEFEKIRGYKDSIKYINKINQYYSFDDLFYFGDKHYIYKESSYSTSALDVSKLGEKKGEEEREVSVRAFALYEVVDGVPSKSPVIDGIERFVTCYNNNYYYFKVSKGLCKFNLATGEETVVDAGTKDDYFDVDKNEYQFNFALNRTVCIVKKKLHPVEKTGCFGMVKKKKTEEEELLNNFCLLSIDLFTGNKKVIIDEFVDVAESGNNEVFYIVAERLAAPPEEKGCASIFKKKATVQPAKRFTTKLMVCDVATGQNRPVLKESCEIHKVVDKKIIYSTWTPNSLNIELRVFDMNDNTDVLIEDNAFSFYNVFGGRIYYTIGNEYYRPLVSNNFAGDDRKEILANIERIIDVRAGWLYVIRRYKLNAVLFRINIETGERVLVCSALDKILSTNASHIYYNDVYGMFHVVRRDGEGDRIIGSGINRVIVDNKFFHYVRNEKVDLNGNTNFSLYKMDPDGKNVKKVSFDIDKAMNFDEEYMYYAKSENVRFKVTVPTGKNESEYYYDTFMLTRYYKHEKATGKSQIVLTLGKPEAENTYKSGCMKKEVTADVVFTEVPVVHEFRYKGLASVGKIEKQASENNADGDSLLPTPQENDGCGCSPLANASNKAKNSGCSGR